MRFRVNTPSTPDFNCPLTRLIVHPWRQLNSGIHDSLFDHSINIIMRYIVILSKRRVYMVFQPLFNWRHGWTINLANRRLTSEVVCILTKNLRGDQCKIERICYKFQISGEVMDEQSILLINDWLQEYFVY